MLRNCARPLDAVEEKAHSAAEIPEYVHELNEAIEDEQVEAVINAVHDVTGLPVDFESIKSGAKGYYSYSEHRKLSSKVDKKLRRTIDRKKLEIGLH